MASVQKEIQRELIKRGWYAAQAVKNLSLCDYTPAGARPVLSLLELARHCDGARTVDCVGFGNLLDRIKDNGADVVEVADPVDAIQAALEALNWEMISAVSAIQEFDARVEDLDHSHVVERANELLVTMDQVAKATFGPGAKIVEGEVVV